MKSGTSAGVLKSFIVSHSSFSPGMVNGTPSLLPMKVSSMKRRPTVWLFVSLFSMR